MDEQSALDQMVADAKAKYGNNPALQDRLATLTPHVETVKMILQHLKEEDERSRA